jgi:hypothetical protein
LIAFYERTEYRVRLARGSWGVIRIGQPLPASLQAVLPARNAPWAFITAWNPRSQPCPTNVNRAAQRQLLTRLRELHPVPGIVAGIGVGPEHDGSRWREPSLFVAGVRLDDVDCLMRAFGQHAVVAGRGDEPTALRWRR